MLVWMEAKLVKTYARSESLRLNVMLDESSGMRVSSGRLPE